MEDYYTVGLSLTVERPWTQMDPLYLGEVPSGLGTPDCYCCVERNGEPYLLANVYGRSDAFEAVVWKTWVIIGAGFQVHFVALETKTAVSSHVGNFAHLYPTARCLLVTTLSDVWCYSTEAQALWRARDLGTDGVEITAVQDNRVQGKGYTYGEPQVIPFVLSLQTGMVLASS
jgi:hypothetical protein